MYILIRGRTTLVHATAQPAPCFSYSIALADTDRQLAGMPVGLIATTADGKLAYCIQPERSGAQTSYPFTA